MSEESPTCVIIGPTQSGKTSLLGALQFATAQVADQPGMFLRILPISEHMADLIEFSNSPENVGKLPGTASVRRYEFVYEVTHKSWDRMFQKVSRTRFSMIDSPGGALLGDRKGWSKEDEMQEARAELMSELRRAKYIMLCADSTDTDSTAQFIRFLPRVLSETGQERLPCEKLVICLTKADKYVVEHESVTTLDEFAYEDPLKQVDRVIGREAMATLKMYLNRDVEIRAGWASVYGFDPETRRPNYDKLSDGLLADASAVVERREVLERWRPYQIVDPFIFLTAGLSLNLRKILAPGARLQGVPQPAIFGRLGDQTRGLGSPFRKLGQLIKAFYDYIKFS
jgi:GTPase SAR1 family protein